MASLCVVIVCKWENFTIQFHKNQGASKNFRPVYYTICMPARVCVCVHVYRCMHACESVCMCMYVCLCVCVCVCDLQMVRVKSSCQSPSATAGYHRSSTDTLTITPAAMLSTKAICVDHAERSLSITSHHITSHHLASHHIQHPTSRKPKIPSPFFFLLSSSRFVFLNECLPVYLFICFFVCNFCCSHDNKRQMQTSETRKKSCTHTHHTHTHTPYFRMDLTPWRKPLRLQWPWTFRRGTTARWGRRRPSHHGQSRCCRFRRFRFCPLFVFVADCCTCKALVMYLWCTCVTMCRLLGYLLHLRTSNNMLPSKCEQMQHKNYNQTYEQLSAFARLCWRTHLWRYADSLPWDAETVHFYIVLAHH